MISFCCTGASSENEGADTVSISSNFLWKANSLSISTFPYYNLTALSFVSDACVHHVFLGSCNAAQIAPYIQKHLICKFLLVESHISGYTWYPEVPCSMAITVTHSMMAHSFGIHGHYSNAFHSSAQLLVFTAITVMHSMMVHSFWHS